ncbi:MAG: hypothetical protein IJW06_05560 [Clostridia bacterium]|nr:hypothetical protein [Clostridia bacterium]
MSRSVFTFPYSSAEKSGILINNILISNKFTQHMENEGVVWKKGSALLTGEQCIKIEWGENEVKIFGWISDGFSESQLSGFLGSYAKGKVLKVIEQLKLSII